MSFPPSGPWGDPGPPVAPCARGAARRSSGLEQLSVPLIRGASDDSAPSSSAFQRELWMGRGPAFQALLQSCSSSECSSNYMLRSLWIGHVVQRKMRIMSGSIQGIEYFGSPMTTIREMSNSE